MAKAFAFRRRLKLVDDGKGAAAAAPAQVPAMHEGGRDEWDAACSRCACVGGEYHDKF
jgi:hypothetical protein